MVYEGSRLVFSALLKQLPVGSQIPIRVCPAKSQLSVVKPRFEPAWWIPLVFSVLLSMGGFSLWSKA